MQRSRETHWINLKKHSNAVIFKKIGIKWRKVNSVPAKVNIDAQQKFHDESLQPRLEEAKIGKRSVLF